MSSSDSGNGNGWLQKVLERIEDHMHEVRRFMADSEKRWGTNEKRWQANHKILLHMMEEIRQLKTKR